MFDYFFIVGAQRSGTTYLYHLLAEHPEVEMAKPLWPEPKYFLLDNLFNKGLEYYQNHYFENKAGAKIRGEKSTSYIESEKVAQRIKQYFPNAKILFLLRDPIERAISNYWFSVNNGLEKLPMSEAFFKEEERWIDYDHKSISASPYAYLRRGRYIDYISMYERYFSIENIKVLLYEQLVTSAEKVHDLYAFLGVNPNFVSSKLFQIINEGEKGDSTLSPHLKSYLVNYFSESNARLAKSFGFTLDEWQSR
jgi:sulfotransferase family protein